ncbi:putative galacturonosyltransferase 6 isoform X2 [Tasmannia lanceolata]|uniref:putative galacturonosyltransferase 6 isoform X2 n=1 Tax=Tasmannia lanceolata TaxID=3420 RepID=UPI004063FD6E
MKQNLFKLQRILILVLLSFTVFTPILFLPKTFTHFTSSFAHKEFFGDVSSFKHARDTPRYNAIQQMGEDLNEPDHIVFKDEGFSSVVAGNSSDDQFTIKSNGNAGKENGLSERNGINRGGGGVKNQPKTASGSSGGKVMILGKSNKKTAGEEPNVHSWSQKVTNEKVTAMKDQLITAKAYLNFAPPHSNSHLVKELKLRIKEVERAVGEATKDSDLSRSALQRMRSMEATLVKASRVYSDCSAMAKKLRAMTVNTEEQVRAQKNQADYLIQLATRTFPKGLHCLSMRLTAGYFALEPKEREFPNSDKLQQLDLYHFAIFSDNILACAVVINSTVSSSMEPEKIVFHVVTDSLNFPAMSMWFLVNSPGEATIQVKNMADFKFLSSSLLKQSNSHDPRFTSPLNHLRFYLPEVFPKLNKIVLLDHDVVVQRDLRGLWSVDMKGKVNGAVEKCGDGDSPHRMAALLNFSDPTVANSFDAKVCTWAFGMNVFDLREWRRRKLTTVYNKWLQMGRTRQLWKAGSLPLGLVTFYNLTVALDRRWHVFGLGYDSGVGRGEIERAAVIHYDGIMKPWLEIGIGKYRGYWNKFLNYDHPYLQQCNIHQ